MSYKQTVTPNLDPLVYTAEYKNGKAPLPDWYGWCLATVRAAFGAPYSGGTAWAGWLRYAQFKHEDRSFPVGVYFIIWFSGAGGDGHVAFAYLHENGVLNIWTSPWTHKPYFDTYSSIDALARGYGVTYVGWSEDIAGMRVIEPVAGPAPAPAAPTHPYSVVPITPKQMVADVDRTRWNLDDTSWGDFSKNPAGTLGGGTPITVVAIAHHQLGSQYYMQDINVAQGYNVVDLHDYTPPAAAPTPPTPPAPVITIVDNSGAPEPQIVYEKLPAPVAYTAKLQPTNVWGFNHTSWPEIEADVKRQLNQDDRFTATGRAKHELGGIYMMTAAAFGDADVSGKPALYEGINIVDLNGNPDAPAPTAAVEASEPVVVPPVGPETAVEPLVPGTTITPAADALPEPVKGSAADWRNSYKRMVQPLVTAVDMVVKDIEGIKPDVKIAAGRLVPKAGEFWKDGVHYIRTIPSEAKDEWYAFEAKLLQPVSASQRRKAEEIIDNILKKYYPELEDDLDMLFKDGMKFEEEIGNEFKDVAKRVEGLHGVDKVVDATSRFLFGHGKNKN